MPISNPSFIDQYWSKLLHNGDEFDYSTVDCFDDSNGKQ